MKKFENEINALFMEYRRHQEENERRFFLELHAVCEAQLDEFAQEFSAQREPRKIEKWLTVEELAKHFNVSKGTIYSWRDKGLIPQGVAFGERSTRWKLSEVEAQLFDKQPHENHVNFTAIPQQNKTKRGRKSIIKKLEALRYA